MTRLLSLAKSSPYWTAGLAAALFAVSLIAIYAYRFWEAEPWLSDSQTNWGLFGDYVGGVIGTVFSMVGFFVLLRTVSLQSKQLDELRKESERAETQRLLASVSTAVDAQLGATLQLGDFNISFREALEQESYLKEAGATPQIVRGPLPQAIYKNRAVIEAKVDELERELQQLTWCLMQYMVIGGSKVVIDFYRRRHLAILNRLIAADHGFAIESLVHFYSNKSNTASKS